MGAEIEVGCLYRFLARNSVKAFEYCDKEGGRSYRLKYASGILKRRE